MKLVNQLINGDSLEIMTKIRPGIFSLVIVDSPYGGTNFYWDKKIQLYRFWQLVNKITTDNAVVICFGIQPFTSELISSNPKQFRHELIWEKTSPVGYLNANHSPLRNHENILIFSKLGSFTFNPQKTPGEPYQTKKRKNAFGTHYGDIKRVATVNLTGDRYPVSVIKFSNRNALHWHPTQKPQELIEILIRTYSNPSELVLDPFSGSGVTAFACRNNQRKYTCIEKDLTYFEKSSQMLLGKSDFLARAS